MSRAVEARVPIFISTALVAQAAAALLWAGAAAERLSHLEKKLSVTEQLLIRTARLEEQNTHIQATLIRMEAKIDDVRAEAAP